MTATKLPQLIMRLADLGHLPEVKLPPGYELRRFRPGDEQVWIDLLNSTGSLGEWSLATARERMSAPVAHVVAEGIHFITSDGIAVATACLTHHTDREEAELGWVGASPLHQGKGLGYQVSLATLHYIRQRGYRAAVLFTDDHRLPAIKTYLRLGFRPIITHESHPQRWQALLSQLGWPEGMISQQYCPTQSGLLQSPLTTE
ncbi:MAG: GNAT family N-acetyltransferase [Anaerolineae bacterium]